VDVPEADLFAVNPPRAFPGPAAQQIPVPAALPVTGQYGYDSITIEP